MTFRQLISVTAIAAILAGCGAGPQAIDTATVQKNTDANKKVRAIFDAAGGDFEKVPASDKPFLIERFKDEVGAKKAFEQIKNPPGGMGGTPTPSQAPTGN